MVVKVEEALACLQMDIPGAVVERKLRAIERLIRSETNNNFQDRAVRLKVPSRGGVLLGSSLYLADGDTIEISESPNKGLYTIVSTQGGHIKVDKPLYDAGANLVKHASMGFYDACKGRYQNGILVKTFGDLL